MSRPASRAASLACSGRTPTVSRNLEDADMLEPRADPGQRFELLALQHLGPALREWSLGGCDRIDALAVAVEQRQENRVGIGGLAQDVEVLADHRIGIAGGDVLEVDRDLGAGKVDAERRAFRPLLPQLRRQDVGSRELGKRFALHRRHPDWIPLNFLAVCQLGSCPP